MCVVLLLVVVNKTFSIYKFIFLFPLSSLTTQYQYLHQFLTTLFLYDSTSQYIMHVRDVALEDAVVPAFGVGKN